MGTEEPLRRLGVTGMVALTLSCAAQVTSMPKRINLTEDGSYLLVTGRWATRTSRERSSLPTANAVRVECWKQLKVCKETLALLYQPHDKSVPSGSSSDLAILVEDYQVIEWSNNLIRSRATPRAADIDIEVSVDDQSVTRVSRETSARGASVGTDPNVEAWRLE